MAGTNPRRLKADESGFPSPDCPAARECWLQKYSKEARVRILSGESIPAERVSHHVLDIHHDGDAGL
jgi:hypothetical protein